MLIEHLITKAELNPKKLFLIDGFGAILSAFLLGVVLVKFEIIFGIPSSTLYLLTIMPIFFATYDFYCYRKTHQRTGQLLKGIAVLNLIYCCISIGFMFYHFGTITNLGWVYILIEIAIVLLLAILEFRVGRKMIKASTQHVCGNAKKTHI
ncbi:hypothetical protein SAMN05660313_02600 [Cellulophaga fucicola]|uniref:Uncharacterized protein n=1 Tax=Cellulophaga fucicola TaxID=76595 RepID=A0A1K1QD78_9FLAO|nr:hypothetical protein SAMN05660313_02600 [Cellulophaga fucicola]